jgi:hypothetical protein
MFSTLLFSKMDTSGVCHLWTAHRDRQGYGSIRRGMVTVRAHRAVWEHFNGPIPDGLRVLHNCPDGDNPSCCNIAHLWLGTDADNTADMVAKGRQTRGERNSGARLTEAQVLDIRQRFRRDGDSIPALAQEFGLGLTTVRQIVNGETWGHL